MKRRNVMVALCFAALVVSPGIAHKLLSGPPSEAPTGFSTPTLANTPGQQSASNGMPETAGDTYAIDQAHFEEEEGVDTGLGPVFNATSCVSCHQNPVTGGTSQVTELRVGHKDPHSGLFVNPTTPINDGQTFIANRSLINDRAICPQAQERAHQSEEIRTFRMSLNTLGDGFVEAIDDTTLQIIAQQQRAASNGKIAGEYIEVPVLEGGSKVTRIGRFGWKDQHASLLSFASDAYLNEQGITNRLNLVDTTNLCKTTSDPEDVPDALGMADIDHFAAFMRGTMAPPVDATLAATSDAQAGQRIFSQIGCALCHIATITTAPTGTQINGGMFTIPDALGNKIIHPFSDFLLHDVGTGDGIVQNGPPDTARKLRTPPLWGLRTHDRLMHDGLSFTRTDAISRHKGEASDASRAFSRLSQSQQRQLLTFLNSL